MRVKTSDMDKYILKGPPSTFSDIHEKGIGCKMFELLKEHKNKVMQICVETGIEDTFNNFLSRSVRTALEMKDRGVTSNDVISMCSYNYLNSGVPVMASLLLNCKIACLDPTISESDTKHLINQIEPKILFIGQEAEEMISNVLADVSFKTEVISFGSNTKYERFVNFLKPHPEEENFQPTEVKDLKETILIVFSSGTTGLPKGICLSHYSVMKQMRMGNNAAVNKALARLMSFASHYWISTFVLFYMSINLGTTRLIIPRFEPKKVWDAIHIFKPTNIFAAPCQILELLDGKGVPEGIDADSLKLIMLGGHTNTIEQLDFMRSKFPKTLIGSGYGSTETAGTVAMFNPAAPDGIKMMYEKKESCGTLVADTMYKVIDVDTERLCGPMEKGELRIKADFLMNGYYNQDSSSAWDEDGWLKTGDVVYIDEDKYIYIVDRVKEVFKYRAWHIVPAKLESVIAKHPDVVNVVVYGIPHDVDGDHPAAAVSVKKESRVTAEELRIFADNQLDDRQKLRGGVTILEEFPTTPTGKIVRRKIRDYIDQLKNNF